MPLYIKQDGNIIAIGAEKRLPRFFGAATEFTRYHVKYPDGRQVTAGSAAKKPMHVFLTQTDKKHLKISELKLKLVKRDKRERIIVSAEKIAEANEGRDIYGDGGPFEMSEKEFHELENGARIFLDPGLPVAFYMALHKALKKQKLNFQQQCDIPLNGFGEEYTYIDRLVKSVQKNPKQYGFTDREHADELLAMPLTTLGTMVSISQQAYSFVGNNNLLQEKPPMPFLSTSAAGIDFQRPSEVARYFREGHFKDGCAAAELFFRILQMMHLELATAQANGVTHPSFIAAGCGVFLWGVPQELRDTVRHFYAAARFLLLKHNDYGFEQSYFHPGAPDNFNSMLDAFTKFAGSNVVFQDEKDSLYIANEASKECVKSAVNNPSDAEAVLGMKVGVYWEQVFNNANPCYVGEEFQAGHTTIALKSSKTNGVYVDQARMRYVPHLGRHILDEIFTEVLAGIPELKNSKSIFDALLTQYEKRINAVGNDSSSSRLRRRKSKSSRHDDSVAPFVNDDDDEVKVHSSKKSNAWKWVLGSTLLVAALLVCGAAAAAAWWFSLPFVGLGAVIAAGVVVGVPVLGGLLAGCVRMCRGLRPKNSSSRIDISEPGGFQHVGGTSTMGNMLNQMGGAGPSPSTDVSSSADNVTTFGFDTRSVAKLPPAPPAPVPRR